MAWSSAHCSLQRGRAGGDRRSGDVRCATCDDEGVEPRQRAPRPSVRRRVDRAELEAAARDGLQVVVRRPPRPVGSASSPVRRATAPSTIGPAAARSRQGGDRRRSASSASARRSSPRPRSPRRRASRHCGVRAAQRPLDRVETATGARSAPSGDHGGGRLDRVAVRAAGPRGRPALVDGQPGVRGPARDPPDWVWPPDGQPRVGEQQGARCATHRHAQNMCRAGPGAAWSRVRARRARRRSLMAKVSGSMSIAGRASLFTMSALPMCGSARPREPSAEPERLGEPGVEGRGRHEGHREVGTVASADSAAASAPAGGRDRRVRVAERAPTDRAALDDRRGPDPEERGSHSTRSASLPGSTEPTSWAMPCATAGLIVYFAT